MRWPMNIIHAPPAPERKEEVHRIHTGELATQLPASYSDDAREITGAAGEGWLSTGRRCGVSLSRES
jgi:hypothetical protein